MVTHSSSSGVPIVLRWLRSKRVAVLKGGPSSERAVSLRTGKAIEESFRRLKVRAIGIDSRTDLVNQLKRHRIEFCALALHGPFGEDGRIQGLLDVMGVPYTGSGTLASAVSMNKVISKAIFRQSGVPTAAWQTVWRNDFERDRGFWISRTKRFFSRGRLFVKPADQGSAVGVSQIDRPAQIRGALENCFKVSGEALVERFVEGTEITVGILGTETLPVVEIIPVHRFYDYHSKYAKGGSRHIIPARMLSVVAARAQKIALQAFGALGCEVYGRVDLIVPKRGEPIVLEVNTIPGMTETSLLPEAARAAGFSFEALLLRIVELSLRARRVRR